MASIADVEWKRVVWAAWHHAIFDLWAGGGADCVNLSTLSQSGDRPAGEPTRLRLFDLTTRSISLTD